MLKHDVTSVRKDRHTFTLDEAELAGMVKGVAMRALKVGADDANVIVGTPNIQVIDGSVAAVLTVTVKHGEDAPDALDEVLADDTVVSLATDSPAEPVVEQHAAVSAPALAPVPAPLGAALVPGMTGFARAA